MAGFLTGIATATKYNGLAVAIALVVAHFFATKGESVRRIILSRQLGIGLAMIPVGFLFGCPTALYEPRRFWNDFIYNYTVTPRYGGQPNRTAYLAALGRIPEIVGFPGAIFIITLAILSCILILKRHDFSNAATRISVYSWNYRVPSDTVRKYYSDLLLGKFPYIIVFDAETAPVPAWIYPRTIDFLAGRITILQRKN